MSDKITGVGAGCEAGMDKYDHSEYLSKPLRRIQQRVQVCHLSNLFAPERRFCVLASASSGDRDCVGSLSRCCARTKDSPARFNSLEIGGIRNGKRTALNGASGLKQRRGVPKGETRPVHGPSTLRNARSGLFPSVQGFSFSFRQLFPEDFFLGGGLRGWFSLTLLFLLHSL